MTLLAAGTVVASNGGDIRRPDPRRAPDEPPPLPEKQQYSDYSNISPEEAYDIAVRPSVLRLGTHKYRVSAIVFVIIYLFIPLSLLSIDLFTPIPNSFHFCTLVTLNV